MSSPRQRRQARTRERILDAAQELVVEQGYAGVSWRMVARHADYSPAGLYEYFSGKEALFDALASRAEARLVEVLQHAPQGPDPVSGLVQMGAVYLAFARERPQDYQLLTSRPAPEQAEQATPFAIVVQAVGRVEGAGRLRSGPLETLEVAYGLWASWHGLALLPLTHLAGMHADVADAELGALEALVRGYCQ